MAEETVVEKTWRGMVERHPTARRGEPAVIAAAYAEPRLTMDCLPGISWTVCLVGVDDPVMPTEEELVS
ncbi:hypothetical protein ACFVYP_34165 [Kitasatospora sp. NPDC058201]|uniref:hypothetical protein n=1 Tax=unclassified Kitasatospora TaxID=2633591 RepID=UPI003653B2B7